MHGMIANSTHTASGDMVLQQILFIRNLGLLAASALCF